MYDALRGRSASKLTVVKDVIDRNDLESRGVEGRGSVCLVESSNQQETAQNAKFILGTTIVTILAGRARVAEEKGLRRGRPQREATNRI